MAIFYCQDCDRYIDIDWDGCEEHPVIQGELICCDCYADWEEQLSYGPPAPSSFYWRLVKKDWRAHQ